MWSRIPSLLNSKLELVYFVLAILDHHCAWPKANLLIFLLFNSTVKHNYIFGCGKSVFLKVWYMDQLWEDYLGYHLKAIFVALNLLNSNLWDEAQESACLIRTPGDSYAHWSLSTTVIRHFPLIRAYSHHE